MIKRISIDKLRPKMYVSDLNCDWIPHHNMKKEGRIPNQALIEQLKSRGIKEVYIDTQRASMLMTASPWLKLINIIKKNSISPVPSLWPKPARSVLKKN